MTDHTDRTFDRDLDDDPFNVASSPVLARAAGALRERATQKWVEVSERVLAMAVNAPRRARPVAAVAPGGTLQVSEQVVVSYLRSALEDTVPGAAVNRITLVLSDLDRLDAVVVQIRVRYGVRILSAAREIREITRLVLGEVLGDRLDRVTLRVTHVHVDDVTTTDPGTT